MSGAIGRPRFVFGRSVIALIQREMSTAYGRSPGGYIWAFVEPVAGIALMSILFTLITRNPRLGDNFPLYFATGFTVLAVYTQTASKVGSAIQYSKTLLAYPNVTYFDAILARLILTVMTQALVTLFLISGIIIGFGLNLNLNLLHAVHAVVMAAVLGFGVGTVNCFLMSMYPIWTFIWNVANRPMFIISGVIFLIDPLPREIREPLLWNPVAHVVMRMRTGFYDTYEGVYIDTAYVYTVALILGALGMLLLHRYHRVILDEGA